MMESGSFNNLSEKYEKNYKAYSWYKKHLICMIKVFYSAPVRTKGVAKSDKYTVPYGYSNKREYKKVGKILFGCPCNKCYVSSA